MSLFGASTPAPTFGSSFGTPAAGTSATSTGFGAQSSTTPSSNIFGGAGIGQSQPSLFGAPQATPTTATSTGFGGQSTPSLFGAPQSAPASTAFGAQSTPSLFGAPQTQPSLFGAPQTGASSAFGAQPQASLFGAPAPAAAPAQGGSLFGAPAVTPSAWGAAPPTSAVAPAVPGPITSETKVSDLPEHLRKELLAVETHLRDQRMKAARLLGKKEILAANCRDLEAQYGAMAQRGARTKAGLELLSAKVETLKSAIRTERRSSEAVLIALENAGNKGSDMQDGYTTHGYGSSDWMGYDMNVQKMTSVTDRSAHIPPEFFARIVHDLEMRANEYKREIDEIADYFRAQGHYLGAGAGPLSRGMDQSDRFSSSRGPRLGGQFSAAGTGVFSNGQDMSRGRNIEEIIRRQYDYFMVAASQIATVHEQLRILKEQYLEVLRIRDSDVTDPFEQADLREKAEKERKKFMANKLVSDSMRSTQPQPQPGTTPAVPGFGASTATAPTPATGLFGAPTPAIGLFGAPTPGFGSSQPSAAFGASSQSAFSSAPSSKRFSSNRRKR